jgi:cob(I)alamin adenosyltransferase
MATLQPSVRAICKVSRSYFQWTSSLKRSFQEAWFVMLGTSGCNADGYIHRRAAGENGYCEIDVMKKLGAEVFSFAEGMPMANPQIMPEEYRNSTLSGLKKLQEIVHENNTQLLVLDEILIAVKCAYLSEADLIEFIENKPEALELVLTGRGATEELKNKADYVTIMTKEKHPYEKGIVSRVGIEY